MIRITHNRLPWLIALVLAYVFVLTSTNAAVEGKSKLTSASGAVTDKLKPSHHQKEKRLRQMVDRFVAEGLDYKIRIKYEKTTFSFLGRHELEGYDHTVHVSGEAKDFLRACEGSFFIEGNFLRYLQDPEYSFYAAVLLLAWETLDAGVWPNDVPLEPLEKKDKELWNRERDRHIPDLVDSFHLDDPKLYRVQVLFESTSVKYHPAIFPNRLYYNGRLIIDDPVFSGVKPFIDAAREFNASTNTAKLMALSLTQEHVCGWLYYLLSCSETIRLDITKDFCAWCRKSEPKENPFLSALMMGLFIVDGYVFDDEKGAYNLNDRGKLLLDYIVEFSILENATRLKIIRDGGNQSLVEDLMKKHSTTETWQELLKNPVEPKFVKYKLSRPGIP